MTNPTHIAAGTTVRFTASQLGLVTDPATARFFEPETAKLGDTGTYVGVHPDPSPSFTDWHVIEVQVGERTLYAPVHHSQFEVLDA